MSEQPRTPAQGARSEDRTRPRPPADDSSPHGHPEGREPGTHDTTQEHRHPWQGGRPPAGTRNVPAGDASAGEDEPTNAGVDPHHHQPSSAEHRLRPRPPEQPHVDPHEAAVFGRPDGVTDSFAPSRGQGRSASPVEHTPPTPDALVKAFGKPAGSGETIQRAPDEEPADRAPEARFWNSAGERDPWRNPAAGAVVGPPAVSGDEPPEAPEPSTGPLLSAREVLFGRRVHPRALVTLGLVVALIAAAGGFIGRITAEEGNPLTNPDVTLAKVEPGNDRPSGSIASVAARVVPAVVSVEVRVGSQGGTGSGVVIDGNGYIVTNNHVVSMAVGTPNAKVYTVFSDGTRVPARIVGRDPRTDLAVLKVEVANPTVAQLGSSEDLTVGDKVLAIGSPLGLESTVTSGIVSSVHRPVRLAGEGSDTNAVIDAIQTDAAINPGNSGGALVDGNGAVVGINTAIRTLGSQGQGGSIGLGFAIPIDEVRRVAEQLIRTGEVKHAELGVNAKTVTDGSTGGAQVQNVQQSSAAEAAGIAEGDVIIKVGDRAVAGANELIVAVDEHRVGDTVAVTVVRDGRELVLNATLR